MAPNEVVILVNELRGRDPSLHVLRGLVQRFATKLGFQTNDESALGSGGSLVVDIDFDEKWIGIYRVRDIDTYCEDIPTEYFRAITTMSNIYAILRAGIREYNS